MARILDETYEKVLDGSRGFDLCPRQMRHKLIAVDFRPGDVDLEERSIVSTITTEEVDRDNEVVMTDGLDLSALRENGLVLFMHDPFSVIGKIAWLQPKPKKIIAKTRFAKTPLAQEVFELYAGGYMRGWSIGMDAFTIKRRRPEPAEIRKNPDWSRAEYIVETADVYEYSAVSIPANRSAVNKAWGMGLIKHSEPMLDRWLRRVYDSNEIKSVPALDTGGIVPIEQL